MKITHVIIGLGVGGAELMLKRLVEGLNGQEGMQHSVISLTGLGVVGDQLQGAGIKVTYLEMSNALSLPITFFRLRRELKKQQPDIVQTWMYHADFLGGLAAMSLGIKNIIWGIRTTDVTLGRSKLTVALRKLCAWLSYSVPKVIICAADAGRKVHEQVGYDPSKMQVIPNGFDLDKLKSTPEQRQALRTELGFTEEHKVIGSVGRFNPIKNQQLFVEAAALVAKQHENARFMMVGRDNTWDNAELVGWIKQHNLQEKFALLGERSDVPICFSAMDIFCLHSKTEGFPNVLGEAMAMGLPCVSTDVGDAGFLLKNVKYLVSNEKKSISDVLIGLLQKKQNEISSISKDNHKIIIDDYLIEQAFSAFKKTYNKVIN